MNHVKSNPPLQTKNWAATTSQSPNFAQCTLPQSPQLFLLLLLLFVVVVGFPIQDYVVKCSLLSILKKHSPTKVAILSMQKCELLNETSHMIMEQQTTTTTTLQQQRCVKIEKHMIPPMDFFFFVFTMDNYVM